MAELHRIGKWTIKVEGRSVCVSSNYQRRSTRRNHTDYPICIEDRRVLWDFPERVPSYVKREVCKLYRRMNTRATGGAK